MNPAPSILERESALIVVDLQEKLTPITGVS